MNCIDVIIPRVRSPSTTAFTDKNVIRMFLSSFIKFAPIVWYYANFNVLNDVLKRLI
jgi:hypothetical protein